MTPSTTKVDFQTYKTITASDGTYSTWTDILNGARTVLPMTTEIFGAPFKSMEEIAPGQNITWDALETKDVQYLRTELDKNNKLVQNKFVMMVYDEYMTALEWDIRDMRSTSEWASIVTGAINQMFASRQDVANYLAADEIQKVALALGNFTIVKNAKELIMNAEGDIDFGAYKTLGVQMRKLLNTYRTKRTKFAKGIDVNRLNWVNDYDFSLYLLGSLTAGFSASQGAYEDFKSKNVAQMFLGTPFTQSIYLGNDLKMSEFTPTSGQNNNQKQNEGVFTGNLVKPFTLSKTFSISWLPESVKYYGHNFLTTTRPLTNSRTASVESFMWRSQVAIDPVLAGFNHIFITELPVFPAYTKFDGTVVEAQDLKDFDKYKAFKLALRAEQPMLYDSLIDNKGETGNGVTDSGSWTNYINKNTLTWKGSNMLLNEKTGLLERFKK